MDVQTTMAETEELQMIHMAYEMYETTGGTVWSEYAEVCDSLEDELKKILKSRDIVQIRGGGGEYNNKK